MSTGAIVGIVLGSIAAVLLLFFLITFTVYWFYKKMKGHYDHMERTHKL